MCVCVSVRPSVRLSSLYSTHTCSGQGESFSPLRPKRQSIQLILVARSDLNQHTVSRDSPYPPRYGYCTTGVKWRVGADARDYPAPRTPSWEDKGRNNVHTFVCVCVHVRACGEWTQVPVCEHMRMFIHRHCVWDTLTNSETAVLPAATQTRRHIYCS